MVQSVCTLLVLLISMSFAHADESAGFTHWLEWQNTQSQSRLFKNISADGAARGSVIASPQLENPNYFFHWTRDAALTMSEVINIADRASSADRVTLKKMLEDYVDFSRASQLTNALTGLGEPKFNPDGSPFMGGWCRPQNDGPALRAMTLIRFANRLLDEGENLYVSHRLYRMELPAQTVIKADLEFVAQNWRAPNCELWEEVEGHHFYNRMMQWKAMVEGAKLARRLGDFGAAQFYEQQGIALQTELKKHWSDEVGAFIPTLVITGGLSTKVSGLDASVILAVLHTTYDGSSLISIDDPKTISSLNRLNDVFEKLYSVNRGSQKSLEGRSLGPAIGRYPEDVYGGNHFEYGNPWVLITAAFASASYKISEKMEASGNHTAAVSWFSKGDGYLERVRRHGNPDGSLSEQIERTSGYMIGARDLTWSHAEVLHAISSRQHSAKAARKH